MKNIITTQLFIICCQFQTCKRELNSIMFDIFVLVYKTPILNYFCFDITSIQYNLLNLSFVFVQSVYLNVLTISYGQPSRECNACFKFQCDTCLSKIFSLRIRSVLSTFILWYLIISYNNDYYTLKLLLLVWVFASVLQCFSTVQGYCLTNSFKIIH